MLAAEEKQKTYNGGDDDDPCVPGVHRIRKAAQGLPGQRTGCGVSVSACALELVQRDDGGVSAADDVDKRCVRAKCKLSGRRGAVATTTAAAPCG